MNKWTVKLGAPILALALVSACGTANNNDNAPEDNNAPENEAPENEPPANENPGNEAPDNNDEGTENENLNKNNGEPTAPEEGENDQINDHDDNLE